MSSYARRTNLIEGIGNEVLVGIGTFLGILLPMLMFVNRRRDLIGIHPDSEENIANTREQLQRNAEGEDVPPRRQRASHPNDGQLTCPICLGVASFAVETNCGHVFCGDRPLKTIVSQAIYESERLCMVTYWEHQPWRGAIPCPSCRTQVSLILLNFTSEEHALEGEQSEERRAILEKINAYNRRFSGEPRSWREHLQDLPTLLRHMFHEFFSMGGLMWMFRFRIAILVLAAFLYLISPLDILPEAAMGIVGFLDDIFIFFLLAIHISIVYRQIVAARGEGN